MIGGTLTIPTLAVVAGMTVTSPARTYHIESLNAAKVAFYDTTSRNVSLTSYYENNSERYGRESALNLFGEQSGFTEEERNFYRKVLKQKSVSVGINVFEMFG